MRLVYYRAAVKSRAAGNFIRAYNRWPGAQADAPDPCRFGSERSVCSQRSLSVIQKLTTLAVQGLSYQLPTRV